MSIYSILLTPHFIWKLTPKKIGRFKKYWSKLCNVLKIKWISNNITPIFTNKSSVFTVIPYVQTCMSLRQTYLHQCKGGSATGLILCPRVTRMWRGRMLMSGLQRRPVSCGQTWSSGTASNCPMMPKWSILGRSRWWGKTRRQEEVDFRLSVVF